MIGWLLFNRPVDRSRWISTVDTDWPTWEYGRYWRSISIPLLENTVDINGRQGFTYLKIRSIFDQPSISPKNWSKSTVDMESYHKKIGWYRPSMCPHTKKQLVDGRYRPSKWTWTQKIVNIDLTHPYFITNQCKWLTRMLTSFYSDQFQELLTKQHTRKKQTHTDKV